MTTLSDIATATQSTIGGGSDFKPIGALTGMTLTAIVLCVAVVGILTALIFVKIQLKKK